MARNFVLASSDRLDAALAPSYPFTVSAWAKIGTSPGSTSEYVIVQIQDSIAANHYWRLCVDATFFTIRARSGGGATTSSSSTVPTVGQWYHLAFVCTSSTNRELFIDGSSGATDTTSRAPSGINSISAGIAGDSTPSDAWEGDIAELAFWNMALSSGDIGELASGAYPPHVQPGNIIFYTDMVNDLTDLIADLTITPTGTTVSAHPPLSYRNKRNPVSRPYINFPPINRLRI